MCLSEWNSLLLIAERNSQGINIMEGRERRYPLGEWSVLTGLLHLLKYLYTKQAKVDKFKLDVIVIMKLVLLKEQFCLRWVLWPLCGTAVSCFFMSDGENKRQGRLLWLRGPRCLLFSHTTFMLLPAVKPSTEVSRVVKQANKEWRQTKPRDAARGRRNEFLLLECRG